jgi:L,D-peptidoglycan transpeptidase YkuD (ErfK/YbiS/YcfS/YnhG family)
VVRYDRARDGLPAGTASWSTVKSYPPAAARGCDLGTARGVAALAVAALLAGGCAAEASPARHGAPGAGAVAAAPSAARPATPVAGPDATSAAGSHAAPARPRQLITVTAASDQATYATLAAYRRTGHGWQRVFGPWAARIGRNGFAPPGLKREGDGRTPSGSFSLLYVFGAGPNPGFRLRYRELHPYDYWDDDPASARYNELVDSRHASPGADPEPMYVSAYYDGVVIGYNTARTPGLGSAIFLHRNIGIATEGCLTLPPGELLPLLRWLNPARSPRIRMGVGQGAHPSRSRS